MPRRLIQPAGADRNRSLGWLGLWWIETFVVHGPGDAQLEPIVHGDEYSGFIADCYLLDPNGRRLVDSAFFSRPKGTNKSGLAGELSLLEALGPCRFAGWAEGGEEYEFLGQTYTYEPGEPMGKAVTAPYVRIMATEEEQTGNVYDNVYLNLTDGPLSELKAYGLDAGLTRTLLPYGGEINPATSGAASKDGGKETFAVFDESHLYNTKQLRTMYATVSRNLTKRKRIAGTWALETTTMYLPGEDSVAEETYKLADLIDRSRNAKPGERTPRARRERLLFDHRWSDLDLEHFGNEDELYAAVEEAYGEALDWNDIEGIIDDLFDPRRPVEESRRYFLNALTEAHNAWLSLPLLNSVTEHPDGVLQEPIEDGETITLGFDGALTNDATALIGCRVSDGYLFKIHVEEIPDGPEAKDWQVDQAAFDAWVRDAFKRWNVVGFFADPPHWQDWIEAWEREFADQLKLKVKSSQRSAIKWWTKIDSKMSLALERLYTAMRTGNVRITKDPVVVRHFLNARRWRRPGGEVIGKEGHNSPKKMDAAMAATLAFEARAMFLAEPEPPKKKKFVPTRVR